MEHGLGMGRCYTLYFGINCLDTTQQDHAFQSNEYEDSLTVGCLRGLNKFLRVTREFAVAFSLGTIKLVYKMHTSVYFLGFFIPIDMFQKKSNYPDYKLLIYYRNKALYFKIF